MLKIGQNLDSELVEQLVSFLKKSLDVFAWTDDNMVRIHPDIICYKLNIDPSGKDSAPKMKSIRCRSL